jgi:hypothetical protein
VLNTFFDAFPHPPEAGPRRPPEVNPRLALAQIMHLPKFDLANVIAFCGTCSGRAKSFLIFAGKIGDVVGGAIFLFEFDKELHLMDEC